MNIAILVLASLLIIYLAFKPLKLGKLTINMASGSLLVLTLLLVFKIVNKDIIYSAIIGIPGFRPWQIIIIFFSVAYVSISTDITGIFDYLAYRIARMSNTSGVGLFISFYLFASLLTIFTSNDIVILTLTPIILYLAKHRNVAVLPLLFAQFFAANTTSMLLYIGNPTNIILASALKITFPEFTAVMWFPTLVAFVLNFVLLYLLFRKELSIKTELKQESHFEIRNKLNAGICSVLMLLMLITLLYSEKLGLPLWLITFSVAVLIFINNTIFGIYYLLKGKKLTRAQIEIGRIVYNLKTDKIQMWVGLRRIPWKILPFVLTFFVVVEALSRNGVIPTFAILISRIAITPLKAVLFTGSAGLLTANIINNQPMSILFAKTLLSQQMNLTPHLLKLATYSSIIVSNLGANLTLLGALAGIIWKKILQEKGLTVSYRGFLKIGLIITPVTTLFALLALLVFN